MLGPLFLVQGVILGPSSLLRPLPPAPPQAPYWQHGL